MVNQVPNLTIDEAEAKSSFVDTIKVTGRVTSITIEPSQRAITYGNHSGKKQSWLVFKLDQIDGLLMDDGSSAHRGTWSVRWHYSYWDDVRNETEPVYKDNRQWFDGTIKKFEKVGVILGGRDANLQDVIGTTITFEQDKVEMPFKVNKKDDDGNIIWEKAPSSPDARDGIAEKEQGYYVNVFPVLVSGLDFDPQEAYDEAADLFRKADSIDEFRAEAQDRESIGKVAVLRRKIMAGMYDPDADRNPPEN